MGPVAHLTSGLDQAKGDPKKRNRRDVGNVAGVPQVGPLILGGGRGVSYLRLGLRAQS